MSRHIDAAISKGIQSVTYNTELSKLLKVLASAIRVASEQPLNKSSDYHSVTKILQYHNTHQQYIV